MDFDIDEIKRRMLVKYPFFGSVIANVNYKENMELSTAGTDGKIIYYNSNFLKRLNTQEQIFVFAHEVCHIAFNHILRSEGKIPKFWNIATDAVINKFLEKDGLEIVEGGVNIADAINYDAEELYEKLLKEQNAQSNNEEEKADVGHDTHSMWDEAVKKYHDEQKDTQKAQEENPNTSQDSDSRDEATVKKQKESQQNNNNNNNNNTNDNSKIDELAKRITIISQKGEREAFKENLKEKKIALEKLQQELIEQGMQAGSTTNENERLVSDIGRAKPIIDWRYHLRETIKYDVDWSYKNAYIEDGVVCANLEEQPIPETEIVLDTSGSVDENLLKNFLKECKNILKCSKLKVGCFDTKFYGFQEIRTEKDIENMKFKGGGGTNFDVAVNAFTKRVDNKIIFTDGCANMPQKNIKIIWVVFGERRINPPGGKVIMIDAEQLSKLYNFEKNYSRKRSL